ncbi:TIGR02217 family protein [Pelagovum sp. HNIBRBA483]|uniref:phage distal tail protein, Rcc01695 family n=1 Tax=Pelagovum sp. HNIBRBA483 TaxID=3233341 RepID=UPI0034A2CAE4
MGFHDIQFPPSISFGALGGPERRTEIVALVSGHEERNTPWAHSRRRYDAGVGLRSLDDVALLIDFFEARRGALHGFRWKDWIDHKSCAPSATPEPLDQILGFGDEVRTDFQLQKLYRSGADHYLRPISKPVASSVMVAVGGVQVWPEVDFTLDALTGMVHFFTPPDNGAEVTAGYEFDVPVRFDTDRLETSLATFEASAVPDVPVVELRQ